MYTSEFRIQYTLKSYYKSIVNSMYKINLNSYEKWFLIAALCLALKKQTSSVHFKIHYQTPFSYSIRKVLNLRLKEVSKELYILRSFCSIRIIFFSFIFPSHYDDLEELVSMIEVILFYNFLFSFNSLENNFFETN